MTAKLEALMTESRARAARIAALRAELQDVEKQRRALLDAPLSQEDYAELAGKICRKAYERTTANVTLAHLVIDGYGGEKAEAKLSYEELLRAEKYGQGNIVGALERFSAIQLLSILLPDLLQQGVERMIKENFPVWPVIDSKPVAQRDTEIADLSARADTLHTELGELEQQVEAIRKAAGGL